MGAPGKLLGGNVLHALLLDTRIHDIGGVVGQGQVARSLHTQQHHDHQHHQLVLGKVLDYAHDAPFRGSGLRRGVSSRKGSTRVHSRAYRVG